MNDTKKSYIQKDEDNINAFLSELSTVLKDTKSFVLAQAPDIIKQIVSLEIVNSIFWVCVPLCFIISSVLLVIWSMYNITSVFNCSGASPIYIFATIVILISLINFLDNVERLIKISVAPKIYLIEYLKNLI